MKFCEMKIFQYRMVMTVFISLLMGGTVFAQDGNISVEPSYAMYKNIEVGQQSDPVTITLTNTGSTEIVIGTLDKKGFSSADYTLSLDDCSDSTLSASSSCTVDVQLNPQQSGGIRNAWIDIPYSVEGTGKHLSVFLTTKEDIPHEVKRRLQPAMYALNIPDSMNAGSIYDLNWTVMGYHESYRIAMAMFDCTGITDGTCGDGYDDTNRFYVTQSPTFVVPSSSEIGDWTFQGENSHNFLYEHSFTVPATRQGGSPWNSTQIVIRFYVLSDYDTEANKPSISLIIPGNLSDNYYDKSGRKIEKTLCPSGGCTP